MHTLLCGFVNIRAYGLLSPSRKTHLERVRAPLDLQAARTAPAGFAPPRDTSRSSVLGSRTIDVTRRCPACQHGTLCLIGRDPLVAMRAE